MVGNAHRAGVVVRQVDLAHVVAEQGAARPPTRSGGRWCQQRALRMRVAQRAHQRRGGVVPSPTDTACSHKLARVGSVG